MLTIVFCAFLAYLLYQLVFKFIIPVYRTTKTVRKGFKHMQEQMRQQEQQYYQQEKPQEPKKTEEKKAGDYIDFEEIK